MSTPQHPPIKTSDVTAALKFFVELSMVLSVDEEGYVYRIANKSRVSVGQGEKEKPLVVYQETLPKADVYVLNPFAEGLSDRRPEQIYFYRIQRSALSGRLSYLLSALLEEALVQQELAKQQQPTGKRGKAKEPEDAPARLPIQILDILATKVGEHTIIDLVDKTMVEELSRYVHDHADRVIEPVYIPSMSRCDLMIALLDNADFAAELHGIRKKTITVFQALLRAIFKLSPHQLTKEKYQSKHIDGAPHKLSSWLQVTYKVYVVLNEIIENLDSDTAQDHLVNLHEYAYHLERLPDYYGNAMWAGGSPTTAAAPVTGPVAAPRLPGAPPQLTVVSPAAGMPSAQPIPGNAPPPGYKWIPGRINPDGTMSPQLVPDVSSPPALVAGAPGFMPGSPLMTPAPSFASPGVQPFQQPTMPQWTGGSTVVFGMQPGYGWSATNAAPPSPFGSYFTTTPGMPVFR